MILRSLLLALAGAIALGITPARAGGEAEAARVVVRVKSLPAPGSAPQIQDARMHVTGTGMPPRRAIGTAQGRLLARRAAVVDGYRKIATATYRWRVQAGGPEYYKPRRHVAYVRGAVVEAERYFSDGRVEVELSAPPPEPVVDPSTPDGWRRFRNTASRAGMVVVTEPAVDTARREISREEWEQLFAATSQTERE